MKWRVKILISLLLVPLMLLSFITSSLLFYEAKADGLDYKQKIVAVVYDDSGSMVTDNRVGYAQYAMQGLVSVLGSEDQLVVFPLNNFNESSGKSVTVDLSKQDRNSVVKALISSGELGAGGGTPHYAVKHAVKWLADNGLNKDEVLEDKEFWLVIVSDGEFSFKTGETRMSTSDVIRSGISGYVGLQTVYFGICANNDMKIDDLVAENSAVSAYYTSSATDIIAAMQDITNRTTGRYTMTSGITSNGTTVEFDLSTCGFSVVSVQVLAQGKAKDNYGNPVSLELTNVECSTSKVNLLRPCSIVSESVNISGYSATISPDKADQASGSNGYLSGDKIKLTFSSVPDSVTILLEPAIELEATLQHSSNGEWKDVDEETVNTTIKNGEQLRTKYRLKDKLTGKDLTDLLTNVTAVVSYNGQITPYDQAFTLTTGKKEVALSVTVDIGGSIYTLYKSWICDIDENPTYFRVESKVTKNYGGNAEKVKIDYTTYYDNIKVTDKSVFEGSKKTMTWNFLGLTNPKGEEVTPDSVTLNSNGTISLIFTVKKGEYGAYTAKLKIMNIENRRSRTSTEAVKYYPTSINLESGDKDEIKLTTHQLKSNTGKFEYVLSSNGFPISFDSGVVEYKLTIGGVDVTSSSSLSGNVLSFMPDTTTLTGSLKNIGKKDVKLEVWSAEDPSVRASITLDLEITDSTYIIEVIPQTTEVDIYDLKNCDAKIYYRASIDGEWLNEEQLTEALNNKSITVDTHPFGWIFLLPTKATVSVETVNGDAVISVAIGSGWFSPLDNLVASFISTGEKKVSVKYGNAVGDGIFNLNPVPFTSRLWRWIVIIVTVYTILHIVLWILGFMVAKSLPKGVMVRMGLNQVMPTQAVSATTKGVNQTTKEKVIWHLKRFIPFKEFMNQEPVTLYGIKVMVNDDRERRLCFSRMMGEVTILQDDEDKTYIDFVDFKRKWRNFSKGNKKPKLNSFTTKKFNNILEDRDKEHKAGSQAGVNETCYTTKDEKGRIVNITFFIQTK